MEYVEAIQKACVGMKVISWRQIMEYVEAECKVRKNGWMAVRGALQQLIDNGLLVRTEDVRVEEYEVHD